jgi:hypothetical protein
MGVIITPTPEQAVPVRQLIPWPRPRLAKIRRRPALLAVTQRDMPAYCNWLEQFQIDYLRVLAFGRRLHVKHRSPCSGAAVIAEPLRECGCPHCAAVVVTAELKARGRGLHDRATVPSAGLLADRPSGRRELLLAVRIPL